MLQKLRKLLFESSNQGKVILKNFFWLILGQVGSRLLRATIIVYAARVLGAAEYGIFSYALGLAGFFTLFADLGLGPTLTREAAKNPERKAEFFATIFWIKMAVLLLTAALVIFVAPLFAKIEGAKILLPIIALLVFFDGFREFCIGFFRAEQKMELEALASGATNIAITIFGFMILRYFTSAQALTVTYTLSAGTGFVVAAIILRGYFRKVFASFRKDIVKPVLEIAWVVALISAMSVFMLNTDMVMLGFFRTAEEIGFYAAGQKIVQLLYLLPSLLSTVLFPIFSRFVGSQNNEKSRQLIELGVTANLLVAIPIMVGGIILSKDIVNFLYGAAYLPATLNLQLLFMTIISNYPGAIISNYLFAYDKQKEVRVNVLIGSLGNIILNFLLIPPFGIAGAAAATVVVQFIYNGLMWRLAKKTNDFKTLPYVKKILLSAAVMIIITLLLQKLGTHLLLNIAISAAAYLAILLALKERVLVEIISLIRK